MLLVLAGILFLNALVLMCALADDVAPSNTRGEGRVLMATLLLTILVFVLVMFALVRL